MARWLRALTPALLLLVPACHGCNAGRPTTSAKPSADWLAGRLPRSEIEGTPRRGGTLVIRAYYEPESLNPITSGDGMATWIVMHRVSESLVRHDPYDAPEYEIEPELATHWDVSKDGRVYTFHLRRGVRFSDGTPFTAADVAATFAKVRDPDVKAAELRPLFRLLDKVEVVDDHTVRLVWKTSYFLALDAVSQVPIQPAHVIAKLSGRDYDQAAKNPLDRHPVGTGPFVFVRWDTRSRIVVRRNEHYWGRKAWVEKVIYRIVPDNTTAQMLAQRGQLDIWDVVQPSMWKPMQTDPEMVRRYHRAMVHGTGYVFVGWNARRPTFADPEVRRALGMLFPTKELREKIERGLVGPSTCPLYQDSLDCDPSIEPLPYDPEAAVKILARRGWKDTDGDGLLDKNGVTFRFDLLIYPGSTVSRRIATLMKEAFHRAGIDVLIREADWSSMVTRLDHGEFGATALQWNPGVEGDPMPFWHTSAIAHGSNYFAYSDPKADAIMEKAQHTLDAAKRHALYRELDRLIWKAQPVTFLYTSRDLALVARRVKGVRMTPFWWQPQDMWIVSPAARSR